MTYYHCSPTGGIRVLQPRQPVSFDKPARVYMTTLLPMALMYTVSNFEYTYGYTREGQIYLEEYFPDALEILYRGKSASLYLCAPEAAESTRIPNERVSARPVTVLEEIPISDVCEALLEQERLGNLVIHRYDTLSQRKLEWIRNAEARTIRERDLLHKSGAEAEYYRIHYPRAWEDVANESEKEGEK